MSIQIPCLDPVHTSHFHLPQSRPPVEIRIFDSKTKHGIPLHILLELKTVKRKYNLARLDDNEDVKEDEEEIDPETGLPKKAAAAEGEEDVEEEEMEDEEDDEGNDYGESYFDNGENEVDMDGDEDAIEY